MNAADLRDILPHIPAWQPWAAQLEALDPATKIVLKPLDGRIYKDSRLMFGAEMLLTILDWDGGYLLIRIDVGGPEHLGRQYRLSGQFMDWFRLYVRGEHILRSQAL